MFDKKNLTSVALILLGVFLYHLPANTEVAKKTKAVTNKEASFTIIKGNIRVKRNNKDLKVDKKLELAPNDLIIADKKAKAEIKLKDGSRVRLNSDTQIMFIPNKTKKEKFSFLKVIKGQVWANIINKGQGRFAIKSNKALMAVMGTVFDVNESEQKTEMKVFEGSVGISQGSEDNAKLENKIENLKLEIDDNKNKSLQPHEVEKPVTVIEGPHQVSIEEWLEIVENQKITVTSEGTSTLSNIDKNEVIKDEWVNWNKALDKEEEDKEKRIILL
jgi:hypothetical protein